MSTIKDVARLAGVSVSTVSRYLNNHPYISGDKKARIQKAMSDLDYAQNPTATLLRSKKSNFIGVLVSRISNPFFTALVDTIEQSARAINYNIIMMQTHDDKSAETRMLDLLKQGVLAGVIMCAIESDISEIEPYLKYGQIVLCNIKVENSSIPQIYTDQGEITYNTIKYFNTKGYRKFAYCTGGSLANKSHGNMRNKAFEQAIDDLNLEVRKDWIFNNTHTIEDGEHVADKIIKLPVNCRPKIVFSNSDEVASGILKKLQQHRLKIPQDIAIIGFDNQPYSEILSVPLTTIEQPIHGLGNEALHLIHSLIKNEQYEVDYQKLEMKLLVRDST